MRVNRLAAILLGTALGLGVGCGEDLVEKAKPEKAKAPASKPTKTKGDNAKTDDGQKAEDDGGVCSGVPDFVGACDEVVWELAWFCFEGELWWLDCSALDPDWVCTEFSDGWDCDYDDSGYDYDDPDDE